MKKIGMMVLAIILSLCTWVQAQTEVNPLNVARAFALKTPTHFHCYLQGTVVSGDKYSFVNMEFTMSMNFAITNMVVNGTNINLTQPIYGIPLGKDGYIKNVWLNVSAETKTHQYAGNGYMSKVMVSKEDSLVVVVRPADLKKEVVIPNGFDPSDVDLNIENCPFGYGYGPSDGKFYVYLPPVGGKYHYVLKQRSTGVVIGDGWLEPFKQVETADNAYVGMTYIGNVALLSFPNQEGLDDWVGLGNQQFNCEVPWSNGRTRQGKVITTDVGTGGLEIIVSTPSWVYVQQATTDGDMPFLKLEGFTPIVGETRLHTTIPKVGKVVVTIIPREDSVQHLENGVWINLHRFYGPFVPPVIVGGDGKG